MILRRHFAFLGIDFCFRECYNTVKKLRLDDTNMDIQTLTLGPCMTNCYIFSADGKHCAIVDPADNAAAIVHAVESKNYTPDAVLLTHAHIDHIFALPEVLNHFTCPMPVYIEARELPALADPAVNLSAPLFGMPFVYHGKVSALHDGESIHAGGADLTLLHTPGHTVGSSCYFCESEKILFSGDTLFASTIGRTDFPGGSLPTLLESLKRFATLPDDCMVYPGHNAATTLGRERQYNGYLTGEFID